MATLVQRSFAGGELAPSLYARVDTAKYAAGLRTCRNMLIMRHGGAQNRPGSTFVAEVKDSTKATRIEPFIFNIDQTYVMEFGDQYIRFHKDGTQIRLTAQNITAASQTDPCVITYLGSDTYSNGDEVYVTGVVGMTELNNRWFKVANVNTGSNTFEIQSKAGVDIDATGYGAYISGGTVSEVYEVASPYLEAELFDLQFVQSADVVTIVHPNHAPRELSRSGDTAWSLDVIEFNPTLAAPTNIEMTTPGAGSTDIHYVVTAVNTSTGEESLIGTGEKTGTITNITNASSNTVTSTAHGLATNDIITISGVVGMTEVNGPRYRALLVDANNFRLVNLGGGTVDTTSFGTYVSGGTFIQVGVSRTGVAAITTSNTTRLSWDLVPGADEYVIYKQAPRNTSNLTDIYGFLGISRTNSFTDIGTEPDYNDSPPAAVNLFSSTDNYPSAVTYVQQRRAFANTNSDPERIWLSRTGNFSNFTRKAPLQDDDSMNFVLAGRQVNAVRHLLDLGRLIAFTQGGEWAIQGDSANIITPTDVNPIQYGYNGSANLPPLVIGGNALYVQARGSIVRDLNFDDASQSYRGQDLTIFSAHLFDEFTLIDWTYQQIPHSVVWVVRSDGIMLGLTYVREHEMWAWHRHDFQDGLVKSVCCIPDGNEDSLYAVVERTIDGRTTKYIERFNTRQVSPDTIVDSIFMDSTLTYDGRHTGATTMTLSGGTTWAFDESLTLTASAGTFTSAYVGNEIHMTGSDGTIIRFTIDAFSSATVVTGRPNRTVPASMRSVAISNWSYAVDELSGLWHLEGKQVSVFADGFVVANPNNEAYTTVTVTDGTVSLDKHYAVIHVGLPYISDIETLDIDTPQGETMADKNKIVNRVSVFVEDSRGIWAGAKPPTDDDVDPLEGLYELKIRNTESYDAPVALQTGVVDITIKSEWNSNGRVFIRQIDPVPLAVLAVAPAGLFPLRG